MDVLVGVSVIDDEQSAICVYFSEGREVEVGESVIHDLRSVFISIRVRRVCVGVSVIHDLGSSICVFFSDGRGI